MSTELSSPPLPEPPVPEAPAPEDSVPEVGAAPRPGRLRRFFSDLKEAIGGSDQDFTSGPLGRAIFLLAVPMVLEMVMESLFAIADVFWVSRLGAEAVTTVGLTEAVVTLIFAVAIGLSMATTAVVARRIGEKNREGAAVAAVQAILVGVAASAVIALPGIFFAEKILGLMGAEASVIAGGAGYTRVLIGGSVTIMLLFLNNAIFRGAGNAAVAMRVLWLANGINIVLDPCLIFGIGPFPELGVMGAAVATTIGRGTGVLYQLWLLTNGKNRVVIGLAQLRVVPEVMIRLLRLSVGGILQFFWATASWVALVRIIALFGSTAVAGYTIAIRIVVFTILPAWGMSNAAATLVGQSLGAGKPERAERAVWKTGFYNASFMIGIALLFIGLAPWLVGIFTTDPEVRSYGISCLRFVAYGYGFYAYGMVIVQAFNGAGDTTTPSIINFACYWLFQIPLAYLLARSAGLGPLGVFMSITIAESLLAVVGILVFRRGKWKSRVV